MIVCGHGARSAREKPTMFDEKAFERFKAFIAQADAQIYGIVLRRGYAKPPPKRNTFATVVGSVIGQRIKFARARALRGALYTKLGTDDFRPQQVGELGAEGLKALGVGQKRCETIMRLTDLVLAGGLRLETPADIRRLSDVKGIGQWTVGCAAVVHSLSVDDARFDDTLLHSDLIIKRGIKALYGLTRTAEILELAQKWSPWKGVVTWYLWKEYT